MRHIRNPRTYLLLSVDDNGLETLEAVETKRTKTDEGRSLVAAAHARAGSGDSLSDTGNDRGEDVELVLGTLLVVTLALKADAETLGDVLDTLIWVDEKSKKRKGQGVSARALISSRERKTGRTWAQMALLRSVWMRMSSPTSLPMCFWANSLTALTAQGAGREEQQREPDCPSAGRKQARRLWTYRAS